MASIFRKDDNIKNHPKRNVFDLSSQNNLTLNMGNLYPVFKKVVYPGDSIKIDPRFGLRYLPQVFPVQTRQRASIKFYYVRNRNLWKDWPDFIGKTKQGLIPPYLYFDDVANRFLRPSGLADYMGLPIHVKPSVNGRQYLKAAQPNFVQGNDYAFIPNTDTTLSNEKGDPFSILTRKYIGTKFGLPTVNQDDIVPMDWLYGGASAGSAVVMPQFLNNSLGIGSYYRPTTWNTEQIYLGLYRKPLVPMNGEFEVNFNYDASGMAVFAILRDTTGVDYLRPLRNEYGNNIVNISTPISVKTLVNEDTSATSVVSINVQFKSVVGYVAIDRYAIGIESPELPSFDMSISLTENNDVCWCDVAYTDWPFANVDKPDGIRLSAFYPRAIQSIYNALIRHPENNPLLIDGVPEYNKYITSNEGGAQGVFKLLEHYRCNWSDDRFTTALPSPQQGNAPLVGLTGTTGATFVIGNEDGSQQMIKLSVDSETGDVVGVNAGSTANADLVSEMWNAVDYGISINDLRNVNAYQRWKENNIRGGYKYKDQIDTHYGVSVRYDILDMPEFIGGVTRDVNVSQITQTVENEYGNLGDYAGQSYIIGDDGHSIEHYCDEHGFIIGILCVYPMPIYQDVLSKDWLINDAMDYYFPEFGKIGPQPITNKEISFSQSVLEGNENDTFGYQRAWYDMLDSLDEVHGLFQSDFRNYLIARDFLQVPTLGSDFLTIDSEDINNTFYTDDDKDKILGQIYFDVSMKRPVPLTGIPSIE